MSSPRSPYKSRLLTNLNRQSLKLRDRLGQTVRQIQQVAHWGVQALISPLYWLLHPQEWLGPVLGSQGAVKQNLLPETDSPAPNSPFPEEQTISTTAFQLTSDQPLQAILAQLEPLLTTDLDYPTEPKPDSPSFPVRLKLPPLRTYLLPPTTPDKAAPPQPQAFPITLTPPADIETIPTPAEHPETGHWTQGLKIFLGIEKRNTSLSIRGIASQLSNRRLVLVTVDNLSLDLLTPQQQQQLQLCIQQELAQLEYQRRYLWALQQETWHGVPLTTADHQQVRQPINWLWQVLYFWQAKKLPDTLAQPQALLQSLTRSTLPEGAETTNALEPSPQRLLQLPQPLQNQLKKWSTSTPLGEQTNPNSPPNPDQLQQLLQAALDYFFKRDTVHTVSATSTPAPALTPTSPGLTENWLDWQDLFPPQSPPRTLSSHSDTTVITDDTASSDWSEVSLTAADLFPQRLTPPSPQSSALELATPKTTSAVRAPKNGAIAFSPSTDLAASPQLFPATNDPWDEDWLDSQWVSHLQRQTEKAPLPSSSDLAPHAAAKSHSQLETAFDWIETQARTLGHEKHLLVWCLELLDTVIYGIEEAGKWVWQRLQRLLGNLRSKVVHYRQDSLR